MVYRFSSQKHFIPRLRPRRHRQRILAHLPPRPNPRYHAERKKAKLLVACHKSLWLSAPQLYYSLPIFSYCPFRSPHHCANVLSSYRCSQDAYAKLFQAVFSALQQLRVLDLHNCRRSLGHRRPGRYPHSYAWANVEVLGIRLPCRQARQSRCRATLDLVQCVSLTLFLLSVCLSFFASLCICTPPCLYLFISLCLYLSLAPPLSVSDIFPSFCNTPAVTADKT